MELVVGPFQSKEHTPKHMATFWKHFHHYGRNMSWSYYDFIVRSWRRDGDKSMNVVLKSIMFQDCRKPGMSGKKYIQVVLRRIWRRGPSYNCHE
jgi:hypothetical protein